MLKWIYIIHDYTVMSFPEHHGHGWKFGSVIHISLQSLISVRRSRICDVVLSSIKCNSAFSCSLISSSLGITGLITCMSVKNNI